MIRSCSLAMTGFLTLSALSALLPAPLSAACQQPPPITEGFTYKTLGSTRLNLVPEKPPGWKATDYRPALVHFYGGSWVKRCWYRDSLDHRYVRDSLGLMLFRVDYRILG